VSRSTETVWAPYMRWAKTHPRARHDLTGSNLFPLTVEELEGARASLELSGPNDEGYVPLVEAIGTHYGVPAGHVATAAGASGANFLAIAALAGPGDEVIVERPGYDPHEGAARLVGAQVRHLNRSFEEGWAVDPDRLAHILTPRTRLVILSNSHNPSGALAKAEVLDRVAEVASRVGAYVMVDEVYLDSVYDVPAESVAGRSDRFIATSSLTKSYGLSGLRSGWAVAEPGIAAAMNRVRDAVDAVGAFPAERLSLLAFQQLDRIRARARAILQKNMGALKAVVARHPSLRWVEPAGGAVAFPRIHGLDDAEPFVQILLDRYGIGVVSGRFFGCPEHFRVAVGGDPEILEPALEALDGALADRCWENAAT